MNAHTNNIKYQPESYADIKARIAQRGPKDYSTLGIAANKRPLITLNFPLINRPPSHIITLYQN